jgi:glycosyltransferase involved in cell wall biosynthesis
MKVAIVHDWLTGMRGGERVLEALLRLHPDAEIFTLLHVRGSVSPLIEARPIHTSAIQRVPFAAERYRNLLPLFPRAVESLDLRGFDLVISSSHCVAKGARIPPGATHLCYCHTPMRYVWDQYDAYFRAGRAGFAVRTAMRALAPSLRAWDVRTSAGVHRFVANSSHVRDRIRRHYHREAVVVHPPVDVDRFRPGPERRDHYVMVGAHAPYKRLDLAVEAFAHLDRKLLVIGRAAGRGASARIDGRAMPPNVEVLGDVGEDVIVEVLGSARALVQPGVEDFGIATVEALASGTPVVALGQGGVLDLVRPLGDGSSEPPTGVFFDEATPDALVAAVRRLETFDFDRGALVVAARAFGEPRFAEAMRAEVAHALAARGS